MEEMETSRTGAFTQMAPLAAGTEMGNLFHAKATRLTRNPQSLVFAAKCLLHSPASASGSFWSSDHM